MTSASALVDVVALSLFHNIREGIETGRITNLNIVQTEVEAAIAELNRRPLLEGPTQINDFVGKLLLETRSLQEKVVQCESRLTKFESRFVALKEEASRIVARTEAGDLLMRQQKENSKVLAVIEVTTPAPCLVPASSPSDHVFCPTTSRPAVVSFPGGPRTITIHPPGSPNYQSTICDEKGDAIITLKCSKPLRREGAFRGPIEDIDWAEIYRVYGRGPELGRSRSVPTVPRWPDQSQPLTCPSPSRGPTEIIARQRQLSTYTQTDAFGRVLAPDYLVNSKSPSLPTGMSSSSNSRSLSSAKHPVVTTPCSTPPSPSVGRGKKRTRHDEEDKLVPSTTEMHEGAALPVDLQTTKEPKAPSPVKREESHPPEGPAKRKRLCTSGSVVALPVSGESLSPSQS